MILLLAVVVGLLAGLARAGLSGRQLAPPTLSATWLVPVAFVPQWLAFFHPAVRQRVPDALAAGALIASQILLLSFVWINRQQPGFWALGLGLGLNLLVIVANGGWMPISPDTLQRMYPGRAAGTWVPGQRLGVSKDIILTVTTTRLAWLSDRFILPSWSPYQVAFSPGDVFIALGAFGTLWSLGGADHRHSFEQRKNSYELSNSG